MQLRLMPQANLRTNKRKHREEFFTQVSWCTLDCPALSSRCLPDPSTHEISVRVAILTFKDLSPSDLKLTSQLGISTVV